MRTSLLKTQIYESQRTRNGAHLPALPKRYFRNLTGHRVHYSTIGLPSLFTPSSNEYKFNYTFTHLRKSNAYHRCA